MIGPLKYQEVDWMRITNAMTRYTKRHIIITRLGLSPSTWDNYAKGRSKPSYDPGEMIKALALQLLPAEEYERCVKWQKF